MSSGKHENYATLNLIGYGLAKFDQSFVKCFDFSSKQDFFQHIVAIGVAETPGVVKNRQDLFDPFFDNKRKGWWQKGDAYIHRKHFIDSLSGELPVEEFSAMVKYHMQTQFAGDEAPAISPILRSKYRQIQQTGKEAERYFMHHFAALACFKGGEIEDARLFGDGYDFQIRVESRYYLAEVKGLRAASGGIRMTANEFRPRNSTATITRWWWSAVYTTFPESTRFLTRPAACNSPNARAPSKKSRFTRNTSTGRRTTPMNFIEVDQAQLAGEVKQRNALYAALVAIQQIAKDAAKTSDIKAIEKVCDDALRDVE